MLWSGFSQNDCTGKYFLEFAEIKKNVFWILWESINDLLNLDSWYNNLVLNSNASEYFIIKLMTNHPKIVKNEFIINIESK